MKLFCFGYGYTARFLSERLIKLGWHIRGTTNTNLRNCENATLFNYNCEIPQLVFNDITHVLVSIPPKGDNVLEKYYEYLKNVKWIGYFSATNVYGDHSGNWIDERSETKPVTDLGIMRLKAENKWMDSNLPVHIFRLSSIYGPKRNVLNDLIENKARNVESDHIFSRIYVDDIVNILIASINKPNPKSIYNCADDLPTTNSKVLDYGAKLLKVEMPKKISVESLSEIGKSFYLGKKKISNFKIKEELNVKLQYPSYKEGLNHLFMNYISKVDDISDK